MYNKAGTQNSLASPAGRLVFLWYTFLFPPIEGRKCEGPFYGHTQGLCVKLRISACAHSATESQLPTRSDTHICASPRKGHTPYTQHLVWRLMCSPSPNYLWVPQTELLTPNDPMRLVSHNHLSKVETLGHIWGLGALRSTVSESNAKHHSGRHTGSHCTQALSFISPQLTRTQPLSEVKTTSGASLLLLRQHKGSQLFKQVKLVQNPLLSLVKANRRIPKFAQKYK